MFDGLLLDVLRLFHLLGVALGLGLALFADFHFLGTLRRPVTGADLRLMHKVHGSVSIAVGILWLSGLMLLVHRTGLDPAAFTPKLIAKLAVVGILTLNAVLIARIALPAMERSAGKLLAEIPARRRLRLFSLGAISATSWALGLSLGVISLAKSMPGDVLAPILWLAYTAGLTGAALMSVLAPRFSHVPRFAQIRVHSKPITDG